MTRIQMILATAVACFAVPALAHDGVHIVDPYAITGGASGAVFFTVENHQAQDDRLILAQTDAAEMVGLHTHIAGADGVMQMREVPDGFVIPANGDHVLARGGDHVMLMGLTRDVKDGDMIQLTLTFERAGIVQVDVPVDNDHPEGHAAMGHGGMDHAAMGHDAAVDTTGMDDPQAITAVMKAQFDTPENPLTVDPIVVQGDYALASWAQGDKGGRALLHRRDGAWQITLCGGADLRLPAFLTQHGVSAAETLSQMFNAAEDGLGADKVTMSSSFPGVVMISPAP